MLSNLNINTKTILIIVSSLQVLILLAMLFFANLPLYLGEEIKVKTTPIDPRSLFRGNFVRLRYDLTSINTELNFKKGEKIYITLKEKDGFYIKDKAFKTKPNSRYIQCRVKHKYNNKVSFKCANINAFFTTPKKALQLEKDLQSGGATAIIMLYNGKMALKDIIPPKKNL